MPDIRQKRMDYHVRNKANLRRTIPLEETVAPHAHMCTGLSRSTAAVYCIRYDAHLKIGWSKNVKKRLKEHKSYADKHNLSFKVVAVVHGASDDHYNIHRYFSAHQIGPEEFVHHPDITDWVRWLRGQYYVQVAEEWPGGFIADVPVVEFEGWRPSPDRRIAYIPDLLVRQDEYEERVILADDYYTPLTLIGDVKRAFGGYIDLDPASHAAANAKIDARSFFSKADNGLMRPWHGRVWLNPPFTQWPEFAEKLLRELPNIEMLIAIVSCTALTAKYLAPVLDAANLLIIPEGRFEFWGPHAGASTSGHVLLGFAHAAEDIASMRQAFESMCLWPRKQQL